MAEGGERVGGDGCTGKHVRPQPSGAVCLWAAQDRLTPPKTQVPALTLTLLITRVGVSHYNAELCAKWAQV